MLVYNLFFTVLLFSFVFVFLKPFTYFLAQLSYDLRMRLRHIVFLEFVFFNIVQLCIASITIYQ